MACFGVNYAVFRKCLAGGEMRHGVFRGVLRRVCPRGTPCFGLGGAEAVWESWWRSGQGVPFVSFVPVVSSVSVVPFMGALLAGGVCATA